MTKLVIIGAGKGGTALLEMLQGDPTVRILGIADKRDHAPGLELARSLGISTSADYRKFLVQDNIDLIIDVTGDPAVGAMLAALKPTRTEIMSGSAARFMWDLIADRKRKEELEDNYTLMQRELDAVSDTEFIIGKNPKMKEIDELIARVSPAPTSVLIRGESGTGKELVARAIHRYSHLREKPLVTINCTALTATLMESELFGHKKGSFTGAFANKIGLFEKAAGGTIFLDEIGDMSTEMQAKLLRFLQTGEIKAVGDVQIRHVKVRIIAATNRNLEQAIEHGEFREDLFYRFTFAIMLPPLRERVEDIPELAYHFLQKAKAKVNKKVESISTEALDYLKNYSWPGNLRELENMIERAVVLSQTGQIDTAHLPLHIQVGKLKVNSDQGFMEAKRRIVEEFEKEALSRFLMEAHGHISHAAACAKLPRRTFHRLMLKHHLSARGFKPKY
ncbi:MAG: sigma 54-interacting transcriptional regulator [Acidobacteria bacterium]|nr:sigma 54-interacting transcriptional regulator [Acidobacteriota bacterium]MBI3656808.1 sigma 54-interacting transcriptional regulator [Acidobacteriota bacterium]